MVWLINQRKAYEKSASACSFSIHNKTSTIKILGKHFTAKTFCGLKIAQNRYNKNSVHRDFSIVKHAETIKVIMNDPRSSFFRWVYYTDHIFFETMQLNTICNDLAFKVTLTHTCNQCRKFVMKAAVSACLF